MCWLLSFAGRVNKEGLRELMPILGEPMRVTFFRVVADGFFSPIVLPMRVVLLELILTFGLLPVVTFRAVVTDGFFVLIELPMRAVLLELMLTFGLLRVVTFRAVVTDGFFVLIELPMRAVLLELILTFGLLPVVTFRVVVTDAFFSPMDLATRTVLFGLMRVLDLAVVCFPAPELTLTDEGLKEDLRALEVTPGRWVVVRLDVTLLGWRALGLTVVLELLRLGVFGVLTAVRDAVTREEVVDFVRALPALEDCRALGAAEVFLAGWLF